MPIQASDYRVVESTNLFEHPWIRIVKDTLEFDGVQRPYFYMESPVEAVATVGVTDAREVILVRQYRHPVGRVILDLPAGRLDPGEEPLSGARREFEEETGYHPKRFIPLGYYNQFPGSLRAGTHLFFAAELEPTHQNLDEGEQLEIVPTALTEVLELIRNGTLIDGSLQLGVLLAMLKGYLPMELTDE